MNIGILDECRSIGLGSLLLEENEKHVLKKRPDCNMMYLHVVDYNESAIKFYEEKNNFTRFKVI
jgi:ribosomal protein S18 acetylase RimI-like enzyme